MNGSLLEAFNGSYASAAAVWYQNLFPVAQRLFLALAAIELTWSGIWWALAERQGEHVAIVPLLKKVLTLSFFYTVLLMAPTWLPALIGSFAWAGVVASGFPLLDAGAIVGQGIDLAMFMFGGVGGVLPAAFAQPWLALAPVVVALSFSLIGGILLVTLIESYFVIGGGVLLLGFAGSRWTASFAEGYLLYAVRVGVKLFVLYLLIGVGMTLPDQWIAVVEDGGLSLRTSYEVMGSSMIFAMVVWRVPQLTSGMLGHRAHLAMDRAYND